MDLDIIFVYLHPSFKYTEVLSILSTIINNITQPENVIICGDFNCNSLNQQCNKYKNLKNYLESINIINPDESSTFTFNNHIGISKIDHLFISTNLMNRISEFKISNEFTSSDHCLVEFVVGLRNEENISNRNLKFKSIDFSNEYKMNRFQEILNDELADVFSVLNEHESTLASQEIIDFIYNSFESKLVKTIENVIGYQKPSKMDNFYTFEMKCLKCRAIKLLKLMKKGILNITNTILNIK